MVDRPLAPISIGGFAGGKVETPLHGPRKRVVDCDAGGYLLMQDGTDRVVAKVLRPSKAVSGILPRRLAQFALCR